MDEFVRLGPDGPTVRVAVKEPVFTEAPFAQCHASTVAVLPSGDLICAWFGGTREGAPDVAIWGAVRHGQAWSEPVELARHPGVPAWNPVLFWPGQPPRLFLFYRVAPTIPAWRGFVKVSDDGGQTWSQAEPLPSGLLGPIKNKPIVLSDGTWLAGSSRESAEEWYCVMERSPDQGGSWQASPKISLPGHPKGLIQPTLWESAPGRVHALMRSRGVGRVARVDSPDGGLTWGTPYLLALPHNNSGLDLAPLGPAGGPPWLALACNPVEQGRTPLAVLFSSDNGHTWPYRLVLEDEPGEYSYPAIVPAPGGAVLTYTYQRRRIEFVRLVVEG